MFNIFSLATSSSTNIPALPPSPVPTNIPATPSPPPEQILNTNVTKPQPVYDQRNDLLSAIRKGIYLS